MAKVCTILNAETFLLVILVMLGNVLRTVFCLRSTTLALRSYTHSQVKGYLFTCTTGLTRIPEFRLMSSETADSIEAILAPLRKHVQEQVSRVE